MKAWVSYRAATTNGLFSSWERQGPGLEWGGVVWPGLGSLGRREDRTAFSRRDEGRGVDEGRGLTACAVLQKGEGGDRWRKG